MQPGREELLSLVRLFALPKQAVEVLSDGQIGIAQIVAVLRGMDPESLQLRRVVLLHRGGHRLSLQESRPSGICVESRVQVLAESVPTSVTEDSGPCLDADRKVLGLCGGTAVFSVGSRQLVELGLGGREAKLRRWKRYQSLQSTSAGKRSGLLGLRRSCSLGRLENS